MRVVQMVIVVFFFGSFSTTHSQEALRNYADAIGLNIGVCMGTNFDWNVQEHNNLVKREFNMVVAENSMKAASIHPSKGVTNFSGPDKLVQFAKDNNMKVRGHTLVWHNQNAGWICTGDRKTSLANMKYHIETVVGHFKGKIAQWDVVNEAFEGSELRNSVWTQSIGDDFIDSAFVYAHAADPDCKLFYNDYSTSHINSKSTAIYNMVKRMKANGIPIDGVGFQSHQSTSDADPNFYSKLKENFTRFAELGIELAITELDVKGSDFTAQANVYSDYMRVALEMPEVTTYMIWGVRDQDSWVSPTPLIFDNNWQPKSAYDAILALLKDPPEEDAPVATVPGYRYSRSIPRDLFYNPANDMITLTGSTGNGTAALERFNLKGVRTATAVIPVNRSIHVPSRGRANGTSVIRVNGETIRVNSLNGRH